MFSNRDLKILHRFLKEQAKYKPILDEAAKRARYLQEILPPLDELSRIADEARRAADYPRQQLIRSFTFARGGWHDAPLLQMTAGSLRKIVDSLVDKPDAEVKETLDREIPAYFRSHECDPLKDMVDGWHMYPSWRQKVFEDAVDAHEREMYTLSVPALAPQIEGMLRYETGEYGRGNKWLKKLNRILGFEYNHAEPPAAVTAEDLAQAIEDLGTENLPERFATVEKVDLHHALWRVNELYNNGDFTDPDFINSTNRHGILHGVSENLGELDSMKLFCAVELSYRVVIAYRERVEPITDPDSGEGE
jgi:hypothetical protein